MGLPLGAIIAGGGALLGAVKGSKAEGKSNKLAEEALRIARQRYTDMEPWRQRFSGLASHAFQPEREDLSSIFFDSGNPYARPLPRPAPQTPGGFGAAPLPFRPPPQPPTRGRGEGLFDFMRRAKALQQQSAQDEQNARWGIR